MRLFLFLIFLMSTNTVLANEWVFSEDENTISDGILKVSVQAGHYKVSFPPTANPNSGAVSINGERFYGNRSFGFDGEQADRVIEMLLKVKSAQIEYDDRYKTKVVRKSVDFSDITTSLDKLKNKSH
ncbi:hypothetical protein OM409_09035 [Serratia bockelmannii]|uniref:hypothetical protein n=1 Tax=Serratia TaxID=613 RepID=UPI0004E7AEFA|nr:MULTISPECIES: hypothetical protein [Serratia]EMB2733330.1 hypothetical protein [Serratia marcescens]KFF79687.1 hypothetical protein IY40_06045 [Serratia marcescens]MBH2624975.1 hypothetical protein [Serratia marcescens]MBH2714202.1 hypothetical protein [Serratia marcescens]MBH2823982.1 hypothetical protein [Serratia marcescens]